MAMLGFAVGGLVSCTLLVSTTFTKHLHYIDMREVEGSEGKEEEGWWLAIKSVKLVKEVGGVLSFFLFWWSGGGCY